MELAEEYDPYQQNAPQVHHSGSTRHDEHELASFYDCTDVLSPTTTLYSPRTSSQLGQGPSKPEAPSSLKEPPNDQWDVEIQASPGAPQKRRAVLFDWWPEISSAMFALCCILAIVAIFSKIDGTLLSSWGFVVAPNAVASIICTAAKAAIILPVAESLSQLKWLHIYSSNQRLEQLQVFDTASRGPAGAIKFLFRARSASFVAYLGCAIVLFALALEPFTQQSLKFQSISTPVAYQNSSVSHSRIFDNWLYTDTSDYNVISIYRDQSIVAGGIAGLYGVVPTTPFSCPGANCTFPMITSLGIRSVCEDVTEETQASCVNDDLTKSQDDVGQGHPNYCNYTLPGGAMFTEASSFSPHAGFTTPTMDIHINNSVLTRDYSYTTLSNLSFVHFDTNPSLTEPTTEWQDTMSSYQCTFELCAWSFSNWSYVSGKLQPGSTHQSPLNHTSGLSVPLKMQYFTYEVLDPTFLGNSTENSTFVLNSLDKDSILANIEELFGTNYTADSLYQARSDIPAALDDFATGMTYKMMSGPNATLTYGLALENMTYIQVRWPWLALCAAMVVVAAMFLMVTIIKTQMAEIRPWKSSLAPLIFTGTSFENVGTVRGKESWTDEHKYLRISTIKQVLA